MTKGIKKGFFRVGDLSATMVRAMENYPQLVKLRELAAARRTAANKLNEECRNADVWVPGNMDSARPSGVEAVTEKPDPEHFTYADKGWVRRGPHAVSERT